MDDYLLQEYEQRRGGEYSFHPSFLQKSPDVNHPILGMRSPLPFEPLEEMHSEYQPESDFQNLGVPDMAENESSIPALDRMSSLDFSNKQMSMAEFHSNELYQLNQNEEAPDYYYHPSLPYGVISAENVKGEKTNEELIEDHRNGRLHSGVDFYEIQYDQEPRLFFKPEIPEFYQPSEVAQDIFEEEQKDTQKEQNQGSRLTSIKKEDPEEDNLPVMNLRASASEFQKKGKNRKTAKTKPADPSSSNESSFCESNSSGRRKYTLTKNTKVFDMEKDLEALKDPRLTKAEKQKIRNRISAQKSRDRKKEENGNLKFAINELLGENETLRKELKKREREMKKLRKLMQAKLCAKCKKIQFDISCESTDDDEEAEISFTQTNDNSSSSGSASPRGFTLLRRNAGSALTGGLFAAFIGLICMLGIYMNNQGPYDPGMMSLKQKFDNTQIQVLSDKAQEFHALNEAAMVQELQKYQQQLEDLMNPQTDSHIIQSDTEEENKAIIEAQKLKFENNLLEKAFKSEKRQQKTGFLGTEKTEQNFFKSELDCVNQKIREEAKHPSKESSLARVGSGYLRREREAIDASLNSVYCSKSVVSPSTITLNEDGCNFIHLMIPSSEVTLSPGSLPITQNGNIEGQDGSYLLQIGCKVFQVNKIMMSSNTDTNF